MSNTEVYIVAFIWYAMITAFWLDGIRRKEEDIIILIGLFWYSSLIPDFPAYSQDQIIYMGCLYVYYTLFFYEMLVVFYKVYTTVMLYV